MKRHILRKIKSIWDVENAFYLYSKPSRVLKTISHYEIFKKSLNIKGVIIECGVFKGTSLIKFLTFRDLLNKKNKRVFGFDVFGSFPNQKLKKDNKFSKYHDKIAGYGLPIGDLNKHLKNKEFKNFKLIKGNIKDTIPKFLKNNKKLKISFLHLDLDVFEPTIAALNFFYKHVSKNGIILLDDYNMIEGATKAINQFKKKQKLKFHKLKFNRKLKYFIKK